MSTLLFFALVAVAYIACYFRPGVACGLVLASYAVEQCAQSFVAIAGQNDTLCNYVMAGGVLVALAAQCFRHGLSSVVALRAPAFCTTMLLVYCYTSILWSLFPSSTESILRKQLPYLGTFVLLAPLTVRTQRDLADSLRALMASSTLALLLLVLFGEWRGRGVYLPFSDFESNPLALTQAAGSLLVAAALSMQIPKAVGKLWPVATVVIALTVLLVFLRTGSRGQVISAVAVTAVFSLRRRSGIWVIALLLGTAALLGTGLLDDEIQTNANRWDAERLSNDVQESRLDRAFILLEYWASSNWDHLLLGLGHGTARDPRLLGSYPHVVPAEVLAEEGIVGFFIYFAGLVTAGWYYVRELTNSEETDRPVLVSFIALALFEFILTFKQGTLTGAPSFLLLLCLPGKRRHESVDIDRRQKSESLVPLGVSRPT